MRIAENVRTALWAAFLVAPTALAADDPATDNDPVESRLAKLPPLIDREVFFGDPEISGAQISPDGNWITFRKPYNDVMNIWVKAVDAPFDSATPITADTERPVGGYFWTEDSRYVLYVQDKGGNENYHVYAVDPDGDVNEATGVPDARDLTPIEGVRAFIYAVPEARPNRIIVGINDRDPALHDVYRLDIDTGERELLIENDANVAGWITDLSGEVRLASRQRPDGGFETLVVEDGKLGRVLYECDFGEDCGPARFHKDGKRVYMTSNKGVDLSQLLLVDVESSEAEVVESDPDAQVDFGSVWFSDVTEELVATVYIGDRVRIYPRTQELTDEIAWLRAQLPDGEIGFGSATEDESLSIVSVTSDTNPGAVYLYDRAEKTLDKLYDSRPDLPSDDLAPMLPIRYEARDGREIPGYLVTPKGVPRENLPTVILPHGGPWARDYWGYDPWVQFLANRGYAVMQPNFRGSTGYGKSFLNEGNGQWGTGVMQHDITDGVKYLVDAGIADPEQVAIMGGSYGGYATLAGVAFTPDLYAAGISLVGPSNIITLLNSIPPYWGPVKQMFLRRVGDPDDEKDLARLKAQSPFFHAENIEAPLLIIQGANDPRVKKAESDQIVVALRDLDRTVQYLLAPDEGHGFAGRENRLAMFAAMERFLASHLDGRYQREMAPEVSAKLRALRLDIDDVVMPEADDGEFAVVALDGSTLQAATLTYQITMEMAGQSMTMDTSVERSRTTYNDEEVWRVATKVEFPMGQATDVAYLQVDSLRPVHRTIEQGPRTMALDFADDAITGAVTMPGGNTMDIDIPIEGTILGHLETALAVMPLEPGFKTGVLVFDPNMQQVQKLNIAVVAGESVETAAGTFEAYQLDVASADGSGISGKSWVTQANPHLAVKSEAILPPMAGGGTMVTELISVE
ncbi:MAG: S9 family peptidase [Gammaproteobacteria bacterium]|nr:S9 family peptidase [Gammaproteobacteria bacterium]